MNIIVCVKQVPDTTEVRIHPVKGTLIREGIPSIMNPDDKAGLEAALRLKDEMGAHVSVITMGPRQADEVLREALAMGADEAYFNFRPRFQRFRYLGNILNHCGGNYKIRVRSGNHG